MKALILKSPEEPFYYGEKKKPQVIESEVIVTLKAAALNHRDVWIVKGKYPGIKFPTVLGSDGVGIYKDREVLINPSLNWGDDARFPGENYNILGLPKDGTFAELVAISPSKLVDKPPHLDWVQSAALPLAGLTAYRALFTKGKIRKEDKVLISGIGGGVALFAFQFAIATGANVYVTSGSEEKISKAMEMGAAGGANYKEDQWHKKLIKNAGGFDLIIDSAGGEGFSKLVKTTNPGARVVTYGGTRGGIQNLSPQIIFWRQITILGTTMGNDQEFKDMVNFVSTHQIFPIIDEVYPLSEAKEGFDRMDGGQQFGKIVFSIK